MDRQSPGRTERTRSGQAIEFYHSATQFRFDSWHQLETYASRLHDKLQRGQRDPSLVERMRELMEVLQTLEDYTAFPSKDDFRNLWRLLEREEFEQLARMVSRVVRALSSHSYRRRTINLTRNLDRDDSEEDSRLAETLDELDAGQKRRNGRCATACARCAARRTASSTTWSRCRASRTRASRCCSTTTSRWW